MNQALDPVSLRILWSRLMAVADEAANTLVRTAFSTIARANDFVCILLDPEGNSIVANSMGCPAFTGTLPRTMKHVLERYPLERWEPGDVVLTNDPWIGTGHLPDISMAKPIFFKGQLVAFAGSTSHSPDVGGATFGADARELFEEGLRLPICRFIKAGRVNEEIVDIIKANVRVPDQTVGDIFAQVAATDVMAWRLGEFLEELEEQGEIDLSLLGEAIQSRGEAAMRKALAELPEGVYQDELETDGTDEGPIRICLQITIRDGAIEVDYAGTSSQVTRGLNAVMSYTYSHTAFAIKCALDPHTPNNDGSYRPITVRAPLRSVLNTTFPAPVGGRHLVGHFLSSAVLKCLAQAAPDRVIASSSGPPMILIANGILPEGNRFTQGIWTYGGMGARPDRDGLDCMPFPGNTRFPSIEWLEHISPVQILEKRIVPDSGGAGKYRGGCGQQVRFRIAGDHPVSLSVLSGRVEHPPLGLMGGLPGMPDLIVIEGRGPIDPRGRTVVYPGEVVVMRWSGGGGYGAPRERARELVLRDLRYGYITPEAARTMYGLTDIQD
ncbi:MAG: hydantoinase B/oxoprolinase family protein [bacterium]